MNFRGMQSDQIILVVALILHAIFYTVSTVQLFKYSEVYPVKQLSPILTFVVSTGILISCALLSTAKLITDNPFDPDDLTMEILREFYQFFRELVILGFYMRCFRICLAYSKFGSVKWLQWVFSAEGRILMVTVLLSLIIPAVRLIERATGSANSSLFFRFFDKTIHKSLGTIFLYTVDNFLFFLILWLSRDVNMKFKFIKSLVMIFCLYHSEQWYQLVETYPHLCSPVMQSNFFYCPIIVNFLSMLIVLWPSLRPREYELPLPSEVILANHNMFFQYNEAYIIFFKFARHLEEHSQADEEKRREACKYLEIYTEYIGLKKQMMIQNMESSNLERQSDQIARFVEKYIIPNYESLQILQQTTSHLFSKEVVSKQTLKRNLKRSDLQDFNRKLTKAIKYLYGEWLKTASMQQLRRELQGNNEVINRMEKLNISIS